MLGFGTGFVLGMLFGDKQGKPLLSEVNSDKDWWEYHTSFLYADTENECVKKWAAERGYDLQADEKIIKTEAYSYTGYGEVLDMMLESAKARKKRAKSWTKRKEARLLIKLIKKSQKICKEHTR